MDYPTYFHMTVPHSGTRYINEALKEVGHPVTQISSPKKAERREIKTDAWFCHIGPEWEEFLHRVFDNVELSWMTTRSPIHTWGTHWGTVADPLAKGEDYAWKRKLGRIRGQYEAQLRLAEKAPFIHKVEGDIDNLGEFLGLDLPKDNNTFSRPTPMKEALRNKDVEAIEKLCYGTDFFTCFRDSITPDIKDFYEDLGYDIWWT